MHASGSKPEIWRGPTSPLSEGARTGAPSPLGGLSRSQVHIPSWSSAPPVLDTASSSTTLPDFSQMMLPPSATSLGGGPIDFYGSTAMARLLLAQMGPTALANFAQTVASMTGLPSPTVPSSGTKGKNLFSIADHIADDNRKEGEKDGSQLDHIDGNGQNGSEMSENNNTSRNAGDSSLCCPICHEDLHSEDLSAHISKELKSLDEDTKKWHSWRPEQSIYERCMSYNVNELVDHIASDQRYCKFQLIKQRRMARKINFSAMKPQESFSRVANHSSLKLPSPFENCFPFLVPTPNISNIPTKTRRIEK